MCGNKEARLETEEEQNEEPPQNLERGRKTGRGAAFNNRHSPKKRQRHPIGARVRITEKENGRRKTHIGQATDHDPDTGCHRIDFEDGEHDEFDDDDAECFKLVRTHRPKTRTTSVNQLTAGGFFPKASPRNHLSFNNTALHHNLNAGSLWDEEHEEGKSPKTLSECETLLSAGKPIKKALSTIMSYKCMLAAAAA